jgi:hypothetical protein
MELPDARSLQTLHGRHVTESAGWVDTRDGRIAVGSPIVQDPVARGAVHPATQG